MRLLLVEDNKRFAELLAYGLQRAGFVVDMAQDLAAAQEAIDLGDFDLVVLDLGLPDGDGIDWLQQNRRNGFDVPTLILSARSELSSRVSGLEAGADDYVVKPVEIVELVARLRALMRRPGPRLSGDLQVGMIRLDMSRQSVYCGDALLDLTRREVALIELLMRRAGAVVGRSAIEQCLYTFDEAVTPNAIDAIVSRLRRKLQPFALDHMLHTVRGVGYILREDGQ